nr:alkane hydroxylase MAH1-like [Tanacetum cinerariifolium]
MIPGFLVNAHRLYDYATDVSKLSGGTFMWKGPYFAQMNMLFTTNPLDIHHILSKNFSNYPKGDKFHEIFEILGDGILNTDGKLWEINRRITMSVLKHSEFHSTWEMIVWNKVENGLLPVLDSICANGLEMDLQDIFQRFTFDTICEVLFDNDPCSLSHDLPYAPCKKVLLDVEKVFLLRHVMPTCMWKLQRFLRVGKERKFIGAWKILDQFIYKCIAQKQNEYKNMNHEQQENDFTIVAALQREISDQGCPVGDQTKFLRDTLLGLMLAGKDTTSSGLSWFFYVLAKHPKVENNILEEIQKHVGVEGGKRWNAKMLGKMVYLHGALCESLRLFPPVPFNHKSPLLAENLPSGNKVDQNTRIILPIYSMGRMKAIWGNDCMEFNPERWVSKGVGIKHEPSYKFVTFGSGPRACVGKDMALSQLKIVSATIIYHYHIDLVEGHHVIPTNSMVLNMEHGLKVRLTKRSEFN